MLQYHNSWFVFFRMCSTQGRSLLDQSSSIRSTEHLRMRYWIKLSQNLYYMFPLCIYFRFWFESIFGFHISKHGLCHLWIWGHRGPISYRLLLLYHWMELYETFTEYLLYSPIVHLLFIVVFDTNNMEFNRCMLSIWGVEVSGMWALLKVFLVFCCFSFPSLLFCLQIVIVCLIVWSLPWKKY